MKHLVTKQLEEQLAAATKRAEEAERLTAIAQQILLDARVGTMWSPARINPSKLDDLAELLRRPAPTSGELPKHGACHKCGTKEGSFVNDGGGATGPNVCVDCYDPGWRPALPGPDQAESAWLIERTTPDRPAWAKCTPDGHLIAWVANVSAATRYEREDWAKDVIPLILEADEDYPCPDVRVTEHQWPAPPSGGDKLIVEALRAVARVRHADIATAADLLTGLADKLEARGGR